MPPIYAVVVLFIFIAIGLSIGIAIFTHAKVQRFWVACAIITTTVLLGCGVFHVIAGFSDVPSVLLLYGVAGGLALILSILTGLPFVLKREPRQTTVRNRIVSGGLLLLSALIVLGVQLSGVLVYTPFYREFPGAPVMLFAWIPLGLCGMAMIVTGVSGKRP